LSALAADLVALKVDLIVTAGGSPGARAAKDATTTIPIVTLTGGDPVEWGLVASLARPAGNLTGVTIIGGNLTPKRLELLSELVPQAKVIALLVNPSFTGSGVEPYMREIVEAGRARGVQLPVVKASTASEIDTAFASLAQLQAGALLIGSDPFFSSRREQLVALSARYAVPASYDARESVEAGGLISYGSSLTAAYRLVGIYAGRILKGAHPADLPVQQPTKNRAGDQPQNRAGARPHRAASTPCPRRRGDRVMGPTRRALLLAGCAAALARAGNAQQADRVRRIGFLWSSSVGSEDVLAPLEIRAFVEALRGLGWSEGATSRSSSAFLPRVGVKACGKMRGNWSPSARMPS
jgi:ABC-type uncharacterized transport system substrate-binding protein